MRTKQRNNRLKYADFRPIKVAMMCKRITEKKLGKWYRTRQPNSKIRLKMMKRYDLDVYGYWAITRHWQKITNNY